MQKYRVLPGKRFGIYSGGEIVEHEAKDAAPYVGTHLQLVTEEEAKAPPGALARFADMNVEETITAAKQLSAAERQELLTWERANKNRTTVTSALEQLTAAG